MSTWRERMPSCPRRDAQSARNPNRPHPLPRREFPHGVTDMDKDRIAGAAKDAVGKVEGAIGDVTGDTETRASGRVREAAGTVQNLYGQAKDAVKDASETA